MRSWRAISPGRSVASRPAQPGRPPDDHRADDYRVWAIRLRHPGGARSGSAMLVVVDYGAGNLRSVEKALASLGHAPRVTQDPAALRDADAVIMPGVGAAA